MKPALRNILLAILVLTLTSLACQSFSMRSPLSEAPAVTVEVFPAATVPVTNVEPAAPQNVDMLTQPDLLPALYERINPGVVAISVLTELGGGQGSGFVIDTEGHIVTNFHVVEGATQVEVAFASGFKAFGEILGTDLDSDLAVIKVDAPAEELFPLPLGDSDQIKIGQTVVAIGNPFGLSGTMTIGIISGKGRTLESLRAAPGGAFFTSGDVIQTDAAINPGNSGGPLLNLNGEVIGVNRAIRTETFNEEGEPTNSGIGFAVSSNIVRRVVPSLIAEGKYDYPYLGVSGLDELTLSDQLDLGLPQSTGVYVTFVEPDGPSDLGGVRVGDLITHADGNPIGVFGDLITYLFNNKAPGDAVEFSVWRDGDEISLSVTLGERP